MRFVLKYGSKDSIINSKLKMRTNEQKKQFEEHLQKQCKTV